MTAVDWRPRDAGLRDVVVALDRFDGIGLDSVVQDAALLTRVDRKYLVPRAALPQLLDAVPRSATVLRIDGRQRFAYRSVYLDTPDLSSFHGAGRGRRRRYKVRTRRYVDSGSSWLEVKTRGGRGVTLKTRMPYSTDHGHTLDDHGAAFVAAELAERGLPGVPVRALHPVLATTYCRSTLHLPDAGRGAARVTIDTDLEWSGATSELGILRPLHLVVVETKGGSTPSVVDRSLWRLGHRPVALSKYGTGLAALRSDLPDLKWRRTLTHRLAVDPTPSTPFPNPPTDRTPS